ncbi:MAG: amidohydrolase family protein [Pirellulaceae bacterium]
MFNNLTPVFVFVLVLSSSAIALANPEVPGSEQSGPIAIIGGTVHSVSGEAIPNGIVLFDNGKVVKVGTDVKLPDDVKVIDANGKHVYPGLIDAFSNIGLVEINAVRATDDRGEVGLFNPNIKAEIAVNPDSEIIPVTRSNGVLMCLTVPYRGLITGQSACLQLDGWTTEDIALKTSVGMHIKWPTMAPVSDWFVSKSAKEQIAERDKRLRQLEDYFEKARRYDEARAAGEISQLDLRLEAMRQVLSKEVPIIVTANGVQEIQSAVAFASLQDLKLIIFGGHDAPYCIDLLRKHRVPVIVGGVYRLPLRSDDAFDSSYTLCETLRKAGVQYCIASFGRFGGSMARNLPYHAATASAYGLPLSEAVKAVTLYPAQILGIDDRVGSIAPGMDATLVITDGHILDTLSNVEVAFIQGRQVSLNDRHKRLFRKYEERINRLK